MIRLRSVRPHTACTFPVSHSQPVQLDSTRLLLLLRRRRLRRRLRLLRLLLLRLLLLLLLLLRLLLPRLLLPRLLPL